MTSKPLPHVGGGRKKVLFFSTHNEGIIKVKRFTFFKTHLQVQIKLTSVSDDKYKGSHVHKNYKYGGWGINVVGSK